MRLFYTSLLACLLLLAPVLQLWSMVVPACDMVEADGLVEKAGCCAQSTLSVRNNLNDQSPPAFSVFTARPDCCLRTECCPPAEPFTKLLGALGSSQQANAPPLLVAALPATTLPSFDSWKNTLRHDTERAPATVRSRLCRIQSWRI